MSDEPRTHITEERDHLGRMERPDLWQRLELRLRLDSEAEGLWPRLDEHLYAARTYPSLRDDLDLTPQPDESCAFLLSDRAEGRHFRLGEREACIVSLLDGEHNLDEIVRGYTARFGPVSPQTVERFLEDLRGAGLLVEGSGIWRRLDRQSGERSAVLWSLADAEEKLPRLYRRLRFLFHPLAWGVSAALLAGALALLVLRWDLLRADISYLSSWRLLPFLLVTLYAVMLPVVLTHELAHALTCLHFGGQVSRMGLMMRHLLPAAFADVSDVWRMPRRARLAVFLAGPASTALWAALAAFLWAWTGPDSLPHLLGGTVFAGALYSLLVSLNPVGGYDGSELLGELLGVPDLHRQAMQQLRGLLWNRPAPKASPAERRILWGYGLASLLVNAAVVMLVVLLVWHLWQG